MEKLHIIEHPLVQHKLTQLRDETTGFKDFRECVSELSTLLCYEATRDLPLTEIEVKTPFGLTTGHEIEGKTLAVVVILRGGIGMIDGILALVPGARIGHIGMYREAETQQLVQYYCKMPTDIASREVLLLEPLLASGETVAEAIQVVKNYSCKRVKVMCLVASREAVDRIMRDHPDVDLYCAAIDNDVNHDGYIVPGVGDAGVRMFGTH